MQSFIKFYRISSLGLGSIYALGAFGLLSAYTQVPELENQIFFNFYDAFYLVPFFFVVGLAMLVFTATTISLPYQFLVKTEEEEEEYMLEEEEFQLPRGVHEISFFSTWVVLHAILGGAMIMCMIYYSLRLLRTELYAGAVWLLAFVIFFSVLQLVYSFLMYRIHNFLFPDSGYY